MQVKKSSFTSGSFNLLDEIRRVRSKATEELLAAAPLTKTIRSSFSPERNMPQDSLMNKGVTEGAGQLRNLQLLASEWLLKCRHKN